MDIVYRTWVMDVRVIEQATGNTLHAASFLDADTDSIADQWTACDAVPLERRPDSWASGEVCRVRWAQAMGSCENLDENNYSTYLPPAIGASREPVRLSTQWYWPWTAYQRMFGC